MSDRKYRQPGYQDHGEKVQKRNEPIAPRPKYDISMGPRPLNMPGKREVSRCAQCGVVLATVAEPVGRCPKCGFELHSCKQCTYFDPASRFECRQPVTERVARKDTRNSCTLYAIRVSVERETSTAASRVDDARKAFENLFKK